MSFQGVPTVGDSSQWNYPQLSMATRPNWCLFFSRLPVAVTRSKEFPSSGSASQNTLRLYFWLEGPVDQARFMGSEVTHCGPERCSGSVLWRDSGISSHYLYKTFKLTWNSYTNVPESGKSFQPIETTSGGAAQCCVAEQTAVEY